jgi:hypothetical protein
MKNLSLHIFLYILCLVCIYYKIDLEYSPLSVQTLSRLLCLENRYSNSGVYMLRHHHANPFSYHYIIIATCLNDLS